MGRAARNATICKPTVFAERVAGVIENAVVTEIRNGYDGDLFWYYTIECEKGEIVAHVYVSKEYPENAPESAEVMAVNIPEVRASLRGMA